MAWAVLPSVTVQMSDRSRIVIASADGAERQVLAEWLATDGHEPIGCPHAAAAIREINGRSCTLLIADSDFAFRDGLQTTWRARYPSMPLLVIGNPDPGAQRAAESRRAVYLTRPVERGTLLCRVAMAIMEGRPDRRSPRKPVQVDAVVQGVMARLLDVSPEGMRLALPRDHRSPPPPPYFRLAIPVFGVGLTVQRVWATTQQGATTQKVTLCGGALSRNPARSEQAWHRFVEMIRTGP